MLNLIDQTDPHSASWAKCGQLAQRIMGTKGAAGPGVVMMALRRLEAMVAVSDPHCAALFDVQAMSGAMRTAPPSEDETLAAFEAVLAREPAKSCHDYARDIATIAEWTSPVGEACAKGEN